MKTKLLQWWYAFLRRHTYVTVAFTEDRKMYYVKRLASARRASFSATKHQMPPPSEGSGWLSSTIVISKNTGEEYWRIIYPFAFYKLPHHNRLERVRRDDDLVVDYEIDTGRFLSETRRST